MDITPVVGLRFYAQTFLRGGGEPVLCEIVEIRDGEIVRYKPVDGDDFVGEIHVNFFWRVVLSLPKGS